MKQTWWGATSNFTATGESLTMGKLDVAIEVIKQQFPDPFPIGYRVPRSFAHRAREIIAENTPSAISTHPLYDGLMIVADDSVDKPIPFFSWNDLKEKTHEC